jgi:hypothetical protein
MLAFRVAFIDTSEASMGVLSYDRQRGLSLARLLW